MKIRFFSKINSNRRFDYAPRYYDERKDRLDSMARKYESSEEMDDEQRHSMLRQSISDTWGRGENRTKHKVSSNGRFVIILIILIAILYFIFQSGSTIDTIVETLD